MGRAIDEDAVIEAIKMYFKSEVDAISHDADFEVVTRTCDRILEQNAELCKVISKLPTVEPEVLACGSGELTEEAKWIPCKVRKPEKSGQYLVTKRQKTGQIILATAHYSTAYDEWSGSGSFKEVLAWMPLPSPYKEAENNG